MKPIDIKLQVLMAGARIKPERSNAQPKEAYRDPSASVKFEKEKLVKQRKRKTK